MNDNHTITAISPLVLEAAASVTKTQAAAAFAKPATPTLQLAAPSVVIPAIVAPIKAQAVKGAAVGKSSDVTPDPLLLHILQTRRAHTSVGDNNFRLWLHAEIAKLGYKPIVAKEGSIMVVADKKSTTLFSCHIDTCHSVKESDGSKQALDFDANFGHIYLRDKATSGCLGGDDGVGVYLMLKMLKAKVKGSYVFHTGEERGGIGSRAVLATQKEWLEGFDRCIAFDRAVRHAEAPEVVLTQGGSSCASLAFGNQLKDELNKFEFDDAWVISHGGTFTDSKVYASVIPECVNLGCFYVHQHSANEVVDAFGVEKLLTACLKIKWGDLKASRKPEAEYVRPAYQRPAHLQGAYFPPVKRTLTAQEQAQKDFDDDDLFSRSNGGFMFGKEHFYTDADKPAAAPAAKASAKLTVFEELLTMSKDDITDLVETEPTIATDMLMLLLVKYEGLKAQVKKLDSFLGG